MKNDNDVEIQDGGLGLCAWGPMFQDSKIKRSDQSSYVQVCSNDEWATEWQLQKVEHSAIPVLSTPGKLKLHNASQSSTHPTDGSLIKSGPQLAIDDNTDGDRFETFSVTHTQNETNPWWEASLTDVSFIKKVTIYNRTEYKPERIIGFKLKIYRLTEVMFEFQDDSSSSKVSYDIFPNVVGDKVRIELEGDDRVLSLAEVELNGFYLP